MKTYLPLANPPRRSAIKALGLSTVAATFAGTGLLTLTGTNADAAETYPSRSVLMVVPFAAGGGTDIEARVTAQELGKALGETFIIENRPGAGGNIGAQYVGRQRGDGYTLLFGSTGTHVANQYLYKHLPFDPVKDFVPVTLIAIFDNVVVVPEKSPFKTFKEMVAFAKANPGKLSYGIGTIGSSSYLAAETLKHAAGIQATAIPYNGSGQAMTDLLSGRLDFMIDLVGTQFPNIKAGKLRPIATTGDKRNENTPDIPTVAELGYPGYNAIGIIALFAPAGTPQAIVDKLYKTIDTIFRAPSFQKTMEGRGFEFVSMEPGKLAAFLVEERQKYSTVIERANIHLD
jgi:tripartite-type tricarboxylate transporter receptor subunit TctC